MRRLLYLGLLAIVSTNQLILAHGIHHDNLVPHERLHSRRNASTILAQGVPPLTPSGKKAGSAGGNAVSFWQGHISWWYDWSPKPSGHPGPQAVSMLWGSGKVSDLDAKRFNQFKALGNPPKYLLGFNEPDCRPPDSSNIPVKDGVSLWEQLIAPYKQNGSLLDSPVMCSQYDENWLHDFAGKIQTPWDFTAIHVYKDNMNEVRKDIDHYWNKYGKPIWVTEFGCVKDKPNWQPCNDQGQISKFIHDIVKLFQEDDRVKAYAYLDGNGLDPKWNPTKNGQLTESGKQYLAAISNYG